MRVARGTPSRLCGLASDNARRHLSQPCQPAAPLALGDRPALVRQCDEAGVVDAPPQQSEGHGVGDNLVDLGALHARARAYGADASPGRGVAAADVMQCHYELGRQRETVGVGITSAAIQRL
jgi:hypothetical protein